MNLELRLWRGPKPDWASQAVIDAEAMWSGIYGDASPDLRYVGLDSTAWDEPGAAEVMNATAQSLDVLHGMRDEYVMAAYERAVLDGRAKEVPNYPVVQ